VAFLLRDAWTLLPDKFEMVTPFKFSKQEISKAAWLHYAWFYFIPMALLWLHHYHPNHWVWHTVFILMVVELAEYFLCYNEPMGQLQIWRIKINANVTNLRYVTLAICLLIENNIIKWNSLD
jgi:hypothetical protein